MLAVLLVGLELGEIVVVEVVVVVIPVTGSVEVTTDVPGAGPLEVLTLFELIMGSEVVVLEIGVGVVVAETGTDEAVPGEVVTVVGKGKLARAAGIGIIT